jgi:DEAD/DEAH box helicase/Helicase conserved C-terminal domain
MTLMELQNWILSERGILPELTLLSRLAAAKSVGPQAFRMEADLSEFAPNWQELLLAASVLSESGQTSATDAALTVAHAGLLFSGNAVVADASAVLLTQLANHRALRLAESRGYLRRDLSKRLGVTEQLLLVRRELGHTLFLRHGEPIATNSFQRQFWDDLQRATWVSASAPTAAGKTYLVLQWLLNEFAGRNAELAIFLAPTRALVGEIERELLELSVVHGIDCLRVASLPLAELGDRSRPTILVFTQERLHVFLNAAKQVPLVDIAIVDEVHKIGDGLRGVILQDAIERVARANVAARFVFLSPLTENPDVLVSDAPSDASTAVVPSEAPTVTQNLIIAEQRPRDPRGWKLWLQRGDERVSLGDFDLHARPDAQRKRLSYVALALGRGRVGTLVYANGADEAEKLAWQIFDGLEDDYKTGVEVDPQLKELSDFARDTVHPEFQLVDLLTRGVAFHYGNMPTLLRFEIERLFKMGVIKFLVCTSTLVEGVNLACRTIVIRGPRKGNNKPMRAHDFWNLAGRAGRWGQDFHGNIVCVDVNQERLWPEGVPQRARYPIARETDVVLGRRQEMLDYLEGRAALDASAINPELEQVAAYLMAWQARDGSFLTAPSAARLAPDYAGELNSVLTRLLANIDLPTGVISRHPGVSAAALQSLLMYFRARRKPVEELLPSAPESDDAYNQLIAIFHRINKHLYPAFVPSAAIPVFALVAVEWMRGLPLGQIIRNRIAYLERRGRSYTVAAVIRDTMKDVEEIARFRAPKYLAAYIDVLRYHLEQSDQADLLPEHLTFDLYLEFGVATKTLLSLIGIGLSRTSAVAINEFLGADDLTEELVLERLRWRRWETLNLPAVVKREVSRVLERRPETHVA